MERLVYDITAKDFGGAGAASRELKQHLKRLGAEPDTVRRAMIAAYEAEMNVVIHADGGRLEATLTDGQLDVDVVDRGPGIADVDKAMVEGWSTASAEARALGFGAGMGLPNIERNSDRLRVTSTVDEGTRVSFTIVLRPQASEQGARPSSLGVDGALCKDCRHCLVACPTAAIRVRDGLPSVLDHLCVDCTSCITACPTGALTLHDAAGELRGGPGSLLAVPAGLLAGFGPVSPTAVLAELHGLGFSTVVTVAPFEAALRAAVVERAAGGEAGLPLLSPVCPAVVNLVELRFPSLLHRVAPLASPWEALQRDAGDADVTFVVSCPSQRTALLAQRPTAQRHVVTARLAREALLPLLAGRHTEPHAAAASPRQAGSRRDDVLEVTGLRHVIALLDAMEDGDLADVRVLEPYACDGGCFGSPLLAGDAHLAAWRWTQADRPRGAGAVYERERPYRARPGIRLDPDMAVAVAKLAALDAEVAALPGKDCGACGAPLCAALAEDIVMGRATRASCPYVTVKEESAS